MPEARVSVAPGVVVDMSEYARRYAGLNLARFRERMRPEVFKAYVMHIGSIDGPSDMDVQALMDDLGLG